MRYRILILPLAAAFIVALVVYKSKQTYRELTSEDRAAAQIQRPVTMFTLHDQRSQPFRLARYAGRHKLIVVFFDPTNGADQNAQLQILKAGFSDLTGHGEKIIAISSATPFANRKAFERGGDFPFHVLSDADYSVRTQWGCVIPGDPPKMLPGVFIVDRLGVIHWSQVGGEEPVPLEKLQAEMKSAR